MVCPNCNSTDLKKLSLIYAAGVYESRGSLLGALVGSGDGLLHPWPATLFDLTRFNVAGPPHFCFTGFLGTSMSALYSSDRIRISSMSAAYSSVSGFVSASFFHK